MTVYLSALRAVSRDHRQALQRELPHWPGVSFSYEQRGKHPYVVLCLGEEQRKYFLPGSGSDVRGPKNMLADVRRMLREMGAVRDERAAESPAPAYRPPPPSAPAKPPPGLADPRPDGFAPLLALKRRLLRETVARWANISVKAERIDEAARLLLGSWHPSIIQRAAALLEEIKDD